MKDIQSLPPLTDASFQWNIAKVTLEDGTHVLMRLNETAKKWQGHPELPIKLGFAIPFNEPVQGGLPKPAENEQLNIIEDILLKTIESQASGIYPLVLTTGFMKEFLFYISADADIAAIDHAIQSAVQTHEVQCLAFEEPNWESFQQFCD